MYVVLIVGAAMALVPFVWMIFSSFMTQAETIRRVLVPSNVQWATTRSSGLHV